jgi:hypothetical protein
MASDFSVAWQCLSKRTIGFFVTDQTPSPSMAFLSICPTGFLHFICKACFNHELE